jgi:hypothetical protein
MCAELLDFCALSERAFERVQTLLRNLENLEGLYGGRPARKLGKHVISGLTARPLRAEGRNNDRAKAITVCAHAVAAEKRRSDIV